MSPKSPTRNSKPAFEAALLELQGIVERLEDGSLELEQALQLFERGNALVQICQQALQSAELRVTRLTPETASPLSDNP